MREFIAIDFETANPKRVSACAIGYAIISNGTITETNSFLIKPVGGHAPFQSKIHGIKDEHTCNEPEFDSIYFRIRHLFDYPLVGHSGFDKQVLNALSDHFDLGLEFSYIDSASIAKEQLPTLKNHKLKTLAKYFDLPKFQHHDPEDDAIACANIFMKLQGDSEESQVSEVDENVVSEFIGLAKGILADNEVNYKEAYELLYWLEDNSNFANQHERLYSTVKKVLEDDQLDFIESLMLHDLLKNKLAELT